MFTTVVEELRGYFGREFLLASFFPVAIFTALSLILYHELSYGISTAIARLSEFSILAQTSLFLGFLVVVTTLAYLFHNLQYVISRLYEGYWFKTYPFEWFREARQRYYRQQSINLETQALKLTLAGRKNDVRDIMGERLVMYPPAHHPDKVMPTRLGNILRSAEIYSYDRYGINAQVIWPRLRPLLKPEAIAPLQSRKMTLDFMLLMSLLTGIFTVVWCFILVFFTSRWGLFLICAVWGWLFEYIAYRNAIQSALAYGEQLKATFDLYRHELLVALDRRPISRDARAEYEEWQNLNDFFEYNQPLPPTPPPPPKRLLKPGQLASGLIRHIKHIGRKINDRFKGKTGKRSNASS